MATWGDCDFSQLLEFQKKVEALNNGPDIQAFLESCAKELAARILGKVIPRTPVGQYSAGSGKVGGTLRRGWSGGTDKSGAAYSNSLKVTKAGGYYQITIVNPVEYATYVEEGHRTKKKEGYGWCEGKHMLRISVQEVEAIAPSVLEKKLEKFLNKELG